MSNFFDPSVTVNNGSVQIGFTITLASLLELNDIDGNPIVEYRFRDNNAGATTGQFTVAGNVIDGNVWTTVDAADIGTVRYQAGLIEESESISVQVRDYDADTNTYRWSNVSTGVIATLRANSRPPVVTLTDGEVLETEVTTIDHLVSYSDPDGFEAVGYYLVDRSNNARGGRFELDGQFKRSGKWFYVPANRLSDVRYHGAKTGGSEKIGVQAYDGRFRSKVENLTMTTTPNLHRPTIVVQDRNAPVGRVIGVRSLVAIDDQDGNTTKSISVYESGNAADGGYLSFNGTRLAPRQFHSIKWEDVDQLKYHFADRFDTEVLLARVYDGRHLSALGRGVMNSVTKPIVNTNDDNMDINELEENVFTTLFSKQDPGPAYTFIEVIDETGADTDASGHFRLNGEQLSANTVHKVLAADFNNLIYKGAANREGRQQDSLLYRVNNGTEYSEWQRINMTTDPIGARALNSNTRWDFWIGPEKTNITYTFIEHLPTYYDPENDPEADTTTPLAGSQRELFRDIFDIFEEFTDLTFEEVPFTANAGNAVIAIGAANLTDNAQGWAYYPGGSGLASKPGDIWLHIEGPTAPSAPDNSLGGEGFLTVIHEIGHAIGLKHSFEPGPVLPTTVESQFYTVMSYTRPTQHATNDPKFYPENPSSLMLWDIEEAKRLYRPNEEQNLGNTHHFFNVSNLLSFQDSGGIDTLNFTNHVENETIDLREGYYSSIAGTQRSLLIPYDVEIENARGGRGDDTITGNNLRNLIWGNNGNDTIRGMGGNDRLMGGGGRDNYIWNLGDGRDVIDEQRKGGVDTLDIGSTYAIDSLENDLTFVRLGNDLRINLTFNRGRGQGSILIKNMGWGGSRIETLRLFDRGTQVEQDIDLNSIFVQADDTAGQFRLTNQQTQHGFIAVQS